jgi:diguanylate cyclase
LNEKINETLRQKGNLSNADLKEIYESYLSPVRLTDRIDSLGSKVMDEIERAMSMINVAVGFTDVDQQTKVL